MLSLILSIVGIVFSLISFYLFLVIRSFVKKEYSENLIDGLTKTFCERSYTKEEVDNLLTSVRGQQGPVGPKGPQGPKGDKGAQGPKGTDAIIMDGKEKLDGHDVVELLNDLPEISLPDTKVKADSFYQEE